DIQVLDEKGTRWDLGNTTGSDEQNGLKVGLKPIGDGGYTVAWTTVSAVDGHETKGSFAFVVGNGPLPALPDVPNASPPPSALELGGRALSYAGIALAIGTALFGLIVHAAADAAEERRERQLLGLAAGLVVVGSAALIASQGDRIPPRLELFLGLRLLAGLLIGAALVPALGPVMRRRVALACGIGAGLTATLVSHATALGDYKDMTLDLIHVLAISAWSGGVLAFLWIHLLTARTDRATLARTTWRFSLVAVTSVLVLVTAGVLQALDRLVLIQDLVETPYGLALLAKGLLLVIVLAIAAFNLLRYGPHGDRRALIRGTVVETVLLAGVFVAAGVLTALAPPAQPTGAAFDQTQHVSAYRVELVVPTSTPGRNRFVLRVHDGLQPVTNAEKVALRFTMVEHDMGQTELVADERAPGEYVAIGSPTAMYGTWKVQAIIRLPGKDDVSALFTVPISPNGTTAAAAALTTKSFALVVFPDPSAPVAGAPIQLSVVVLANGNPATGRAINGTIVAKDGQPIAGDSFTATEQGSGRYSIDIPALGAGKWTMRIQIGGPADAADYAFTVSP
ncbi:MAG TPA: FixH family protein, partial [Candidatus Saccharimonadales bacterium]|nr:FixH family protein [Candidatus Saccharimonadales bacterium]